MSIINTGLGWWADEDFISNVTNDVLGTILDRTFIKTNDIPAVVFLSTIPGADNTPIVISTSEPAANFKGGNYPIVHSFYSFIIDGTTWYVACNDYGMPSTTWRVANYQTTSNFTFPPTQGQIENLLRIARVSFSPPLMEITLQKNVSERERLTKNLVNILSVSGALKTETSIIDPVIMIACDLNDVKECNYMTVPAFGRSYFVNNIRSMRTGLVEFSCHVDVLSTYASQIRANTAIIRKQENNWNLYLNDGSFKVYQNPNVLTRAFPSGFTTQEFVLAVAGS